MAKRMRSYALVNFRKARGLFDGFLDYGFVQVMATSDSGF